MIFSKSALIASLGAVSAAFLLPPTISSADTDIIKALPFDAAAQLDGQVLNLKCLGCPVATADTSGNTVWLQDIESELQLSFSIIGNDIDILSLNGIQIFPPRDMSIEPLTAPQITSDGQKDLRLGYELSIKPVVKSDNDQLELISIHLQVVEIADQFVNGLDSVELKLLKTPSGKLMIGSLDIAPTTNPIINPSDNGKECTTLICKWRAIVSDKLSHLKPTKGCGSKNRPNHSAGRPHKQHHPHHPHHKHFVVARFFLALKSVAIHVLIPIIIGVAVGMTASLIGMLVGNIVVFFWRTLYRRGQKGTYSKVQQEENTIPSETKDDTESCLDHQEPPPVYEDVVSLDQKATK